MARGKLDLQAARALHSGGYQRQAISRAYYAAFYSAEAALFELGVTRSKHSGVIAEFGRRLVKEGAVERSVGGILQALFELRLLADYGDRELTKDDAASALADAERVISAVEAWLAKRTPPEDELRR